LLTLEDRPLPDLALLCSGFTRHKITPFLPNGRLPILFCSESSNNRFAASYFDHFERPNHSQILVAFLLFDCAKTIDDRTRTLMKFHHLFWTFACFSTNWLYKI
jgi:hypothetical protein